jgi:hypothetical protein
MPHTRTDVLVVGAGLGGVAAALAACRAGRSVMLTEETDWIGGQLTSQAVPPDEHPWVEQFGTTTSYRRLRDGIRDYYRRWYPLRGRARDRRDLNPGAGRVSKLCHEPRVALAVLEAMLAPYRAAGTLSVLLHTVPAAAQVDRDRVTAITLCSTRDRGVRTTVEADMVLDATENGDLLPLTGCEWVTGAEAQREHDEPSAPEHADPHDIQGFTYCFAVDHRPGENHVIDRPADYTFWRAYRPDFWPGPLLGFTAPDPRTLQPVTRTFTPDVGDDPLEVAADQSRDAGDRELWVFRRILAAGLFEPDSFASDIVLVNWPMNDYWLGPLIDVDDASRVEHHRQARQLSLSLLYWLQTEAPRADGGTGHPGLRLRGDVTDGPDGLAKAPYVREARRIRALATLTENDVSLAVVGSRGATAFADSVGVGSYRIDLHPSTAGRNYLDVASVPFQIPLGALVPQRLRNLLPAGKNIGSTHITNGCTRLHPVEWNIGEAAGTLAAFCLAHQTEPAAVHAGKHLDEFITQLDTAGVERAWPDVRGY